MKVAICDDNPLLTEQINSLLLENDPHSFETYTYYNPQKLLDQLESIVFDFFILDIEMGDMSGIDLAKQIREKGILSPIIFLTSYKEYMEEVFQIQTFDYLLKPINDVRFSQVLNKLKLYIEQSEQSFIFTINKSTIKIPMKDIVYFEKNKRQVLIHTIHEVYLPYMSTADIQEQLGSDFTQIHSSIIINCSYIKELGNNFLLLNLDNETVELPISRRFKSSSRESIIMSMRGKL